MATRRLPRDRRSGGKRPATGKFAVGDRVDLKGRRHGVVAFVGKTGFADGIWIGIILDTPRLVSCIAHCHHRYLNLYLRHSPKIIRVILCFFNFINLPLPFWYDYIFVYT